MSSVPHPLPALLVAIAARIGGVWQHDDLVELEPLGAVEGAEPYGFGGCAAIGVARGEQEPIGELGRAQRLDVRARTVGAMQRQRRHRGELGIDLGDGNSREITALKCFFGEQPTLYRPEPKTGDYVLGHSYRPAALRKLPICFFSARTAISRS